MIPVLLKIGPLPVHSFGLMMVFSFLAAWRLLYLTLERGGENPELAERMIFWTAVGGIIGARLLYIITFSDEFFAAPLETLISGAGFIFYGGFFGGLCAVVILLRREKLPFFRYADYAASALAIGYAVGRIGCQLSGDGDYGKASALPWAIGYELGVVPTEAGVTVHPAPMYETLIALAITFLLVKLSEKKVFPVAGQLFALYLILSSVSRFAIEYIRIEPIIYIGLTEAQLISVLLVGAAGCYLVRTMARAKAAIS